MTLPAFLGTNWEGSMETQSKGKEVWELESDSAKHVREDLCRRVGEEKKGGEAMCPGNWITPWSEKQEDSLE